jgi:diguanylate cyclase (GGDEF)-like protein
VHSPTLLTVTTLLMAIMCAVMFAVWRSNRHIPGLQAWTLSYLFGFAVGALLLLRDGGPEGLHNVLPVVTTFVCIFATAYCSLAGARAYVGRPAVHIGYPLAGALLMGAIAFHFTAIQPHVGMRVLLGSTVAGGLYLASARVFAQAGLASAPARRLIALAYALHGGFLLLRPWLFKLGGTVDGAPDIAAQLSHFILLESTIALILMAFGTLMLVNEHVTQELRRVAEKDFLTGVFNRRAFLGLLDKAGSLAHRTQSALPVLLLDLDHFKQINDRFGHRVGDDALRHFVAVAEACLRKHDVLGRMGGEEFAVFLPQTSRDDAQRVSERLRALVAAQPMMTERGPVALTVSIGMALCQPDEAPENALHRADQAMYQAKESGRNRVVSLQTAGA